MPCVSGPSYEDEKRAAREAAKRARLEPMLCSACRSLERLGFDFEENPELSLWWDEHKKADAVRAEKERLAEERLAWERKVVQEALGKSITDLSKEEKTLLKKHNFL